MKFKIPSIPEDDDAKGIVVRVLSFEYYLKPFWLTFKDPYIEVEYQISTRRIRLKESVYLSILLMMFGIYIIVYPYTRYISDNPAKYSYTVKCVITGSIFLSTSIIQIIIIYNKSINNLFNWPVLFIIKNSITFFVFYYLMMSDIFNIQYQTNLPVQGNKLITYMYMFNTELSHTITIFIHTIFFLTILTIHVLNIKQFLIIVFLHTLAGLFFILKYNNIYNTEFKDIYNLIGWQFGLLFLPENKGNIENLFNPKKKNNTIYENIGREIITSSGEQENLIKDYIYPYEMSIFNINKYQKSLVNTYMCMWCILIIFLFSIVYTREKGLRADFILRRVYSDIDKPRNMDIGIEIKKIVNKNANKEDQEIIKNNLNKLKKDRESNNIDLYKNTNKYKVNIDLNEIQSTISNDIDLDEMGSILDGKTVKSFISDSTFKNNKDDIINNIKKIIPKSYTKSQKSDINVNDIESETTVHC